jgi:type III pantothenate kinase
MLLLIDAGNTRIKWALAAADPGTAPGNWLACGAVAHADAAQLPGLWQAALARRKSESSLNRRKAESSILRAIVANVAGSAVRERLQQALPAGLAPSGVTWFASLPALAGIRNGYRDPAQLGCDRFAAAIGARALVPDRALIVVNCGTATTIDAVTADGVLLGGMILPGLALMAGSLARNTAQLPQIKPDAGLAPGFADNTGDAILSGCLAAQAGAIERACALHGGGECIVSGGAASLIAPSLSVAHRIVDNLVLIGLHAAACGARSDRPC